MNILPKKRWHVRTKQNIERVRRDEAQAAKEEKELKRRIQLAEQEARTELLRKKARSASAPNERTVEFVSESGNEQIEFGKEHVNFFKELEESGPSHGKNKEHEAEEKARQEKFEKDLGILTYLGQNSLEAKGETPWYLKSELKQLVSDNDAKDDALTVKQKAKLEKMDPLNEMKQYLAMKGDRHLGNVIASKEKESKAHKHSKSESSSSKKALSKIEELRAKRLKRELEEKSRSQKFLETLRKGPTKEEVILDDRLRKYNSQFNPHLARNNLPHEKKS